MAANSVALARYVAALFFLDGLLRRNRLTETNQLRLFFSLVEITAPPDHRHRLFAVDET